MSITISSFPSMIDRGIVKRGRDYWRSGKVLDLEEKENGRWAALVQGTKMYEVTVNIIGDEIADYFCTCPYDFGPVCKHEVAVLYAIGELVGEAGVTNAENVRAKGRSEDKKANGEKTKKKKRKSVVDKVNEVLNGMSKSEIEDFVKRYAFQNPEFRLLLLAQAKFRSGEDSKSEYRILVKESLRIGMDGSGFIDYWGASSAVTGVDELLSRAQKWMDNGDYINAAPIFQVVIEELVSAINYADDSGGYLGDDIYLAFEGLSKCIKNIDDSEKRKELFDYCITEAKHEKYEGWDWKWDFLRLAGELVSSDKEQRMLFSDIDQMLEPEESNRLIGRYAMDSAAQIKLEVMRRRGESEAISRFINENLHHTSVRREAVRQAFSDGNLGRVRELAEQGITQDTDHGYPGLVNEWLDWLLKVAEEEKNKQAIREFAKLLFLRTRDFDYYEKLKSTYSDTDWKVHLEGFLKELSDPDSPNGSPPFIFEEIFIREKEWHKLLELVRKRPSFEILDQYHRYLSPRFPDELAKLYEQSSILHLKENTGRAFYRDVCRMLRRMRKLGADDRVENLVQQFREQYKHRPALMDELDRL